MVLLKHFDAHFTEPTNRNPFRDNRVLELGSGLGHLAFRMAHKVVQIREDWIYGRGSLEGWLRGNLRRNNGGKLTVVVLEEGLMSRTFPSGSIVHPFCHIVAFLKMPSPITCGTPSRQKSCIRPKIDGKIESLMHDGRRMQLHEGINDFLLGDVLREIEFDERIEIRKKKMWLACNALRQQKITIHVIEWVFTEEEIV